MFAAIDTDNSSTLSKKEVLTALTRNDNVRAMLRSSASLAGLLRPKQFARTFEEMDTNSDGEVDFTELWAFACNFAESQKSRMRMTSSIARVFRMVDIEGSGTIDKAELLLAIRNNAEVRSMLEESPGLSALLRPQAWGQAFAKSTRVTLN